jgi:hypothetical protein
LHAINDYKKDWQKAVVTFYDSGLKGLIPNSATGIIWCPWEWTMPGPYVHSLPA